MSAFLSKYGVARHVYIPVVKRAVVDFAVSADWTPAAGDVKIKKDAGAAANVTNLPTAVTMGNTAVWDFSLTATEMQAALVIVTVADSATKVVEDQSFVIETYGNASAQHPVDLADSVRAGLTALPNAAAAASGGLPTVDASNAVKLQDGTGANQIELSSGAVILQADQAVNVTKVNGTSQTAGDLAALLATIASYIDTEVATAVAGVANIQTRLPAALTGAGNIKSDALALDGSTAATTNLKAGASGLVASTCAAGSSTSSVVTNLTEATDDHYNGRVITFTSGALTGQSATINDYTGSSKTLTVSTLTEAPANTDEFVIS